MSVKTFLKILFHLQIFLLNRSFIGIVPNFSSPWDPFCQLLPVLHQPYLPCYIFDMSTSRPSLFRAPAFHHFPPFPILRYMPEYASFSDARWSTDMHAGDGALSARAQHNGLCHTHVGVEPKRWLPCGLGAMSGWGCISSEVNVSFVCFYRRVEYGKNLLTVSWPHDGQLFLELNTSLIVLRFPYI